MEKFTQEEISDIVKDYNLSEEELEYAFNRIAMCESLGVSPSQNKIAVVVGVQPGAGKTNCIANSKMSLGANNCVIIDNDAFRNYHPQVNEIKRYYPSLFTDCTDQLSFKATPWMIDHMSDMGYNLIIHQTLKNNMIADDAITKLRNKGYVVIVRALAVSDLESKMSMIERSQALIEELGYCRWVPSKNHDVAYEGLPKTVEYIENSGKYDMIEILKRGGVPTYPEVLYRKINPNIEPDKKDVLMASNFSTNEFSRIGTSSASESVRRAREKDSKNVMKTLMGRIETATNRSSTTEETTNIEEIKQLFAKYLKESTLQ